MWKWAIAGAAVILLIIIAPSIFGDMWDAVVALFSAIFDTTEAVKDAPIIPVQ